MAAPILEALDPTTGKNPIERYLPLAVAVATIGVALAAIFGHVPGMDAAAGLALLGGAGAGHYVRSQA